MDYLKDNYLYENYLPYEFEKVMNEMNSLKNRIIEKTLVKTMAKLEKEQE